MLVLYKGFVNANLDDGRKCVSSSFDRLAREFR